eukprot:5593511-Lingulodinium_polyedra.AAC.1
MPALRVASPCAEGLVEESGCGGSTGRDFVGGLASPQRAHVSPNGLADADDDPRFLSCASLDVHRCRRGLD